MGVNMLNALKKYHRIFLFLLFSFSLSFSLQAFEGTVFKVKGKTVTVVGSGVALLRPGQRFGVFKNDEQTGIIQIRQSSHTQATAILIEGKAKKKSTVKKVSDEVDPEEEMRIERETEALNWSEYQGRLDLEKAEKKCSKLGMRLPTIEELEVAFKLGVTESWKRKGIIYWSSSPAKEGLYFTMIMDFGNTEDTHKESLCNVRCRKK
ncbi:MAG: hypothetical protein OEZ34_12615 [Spirochaetia bacterium]|nr:hypothetical protein [Spirochaetia bacterium]